MRLVRRGGKKKFGVFRIVLKTIWYFFILLSVFTASLFFRAQSLPGFVVRKFCAGFSNESFAVACDHASFGFRHGLSLSGVRFYDLEKAANPEDPVCTVAGIHWDLFSETVTVTGAKYPRLPDSYYDETIPSEAPGVLDLDLPEFGPVRLVLERPRILGVDASSLTADVSSDGRRIDVRSISLELPDKDRDTHVGGSLVLDSRNISFSISGAVAQRQVRPLLEALDIGIAVEYMDAFTGVEKPVESEMDFSSDFETGSIDIGLRLRPESGKYNGVKFDAAEGRIGVVSRIAGGKREYSVSIDVPRVVDSAGGVSSAKIAIDASTDRPVLDIDARSNLPYTDALAVADVISPDDLPAIRCEASPSVSMKGKACTSPEDAALNDLSGEVFLRRGTINGFVVNNLKTAYTLKGTVLESASTATGKSGGKLSWRDKMDLAGFRDGKAPFAMSGSCSGGSLEEIADAFSFDLGERNGKIDWDVSLSGEFGTNVISSLNGRGKLKITDGHLAQMKLFAGFTKLLAAKIPGVSFFVNQTQASATFTIKNGVFESSDIYLEGGFFSVKSWGRYDMAADNLDFTVRAQFLKKESIAGKIVHPLTFPFTKFLLEFKVEGPIDDPRWQYISIPDRIL